MLAVKMRDKRDATVVNAPQGGTRQAVGRREVLDVLSLAAVDSEYQRASDTDALPCQFFAFYEEPSVYRCQLAHKTYSHIAIMERALKMSRSLGIKRQLVVALKQLMTHWYLMSLPPVDPMMREAEVAD